MRTSNGFDRLATEEELHQVFDVLGELERSGWMLPGENSTLETDSLWADTILDESADAESLAELLEKRPQLKN
jgi:hypothetical protein